jgi:hypothetical protein
MKNYTLAHLNKFRADAGWSPVSGLSQRMINKMCREFEQSAEMVGKTITAGDVTDYGASDNDRKFKGNM